MITVEEDERILTTEVVHLEVIQPEPAYKYGPRFAAAGAVVGFAFGVATVGSVMVFLFKNEFVKVSLSSAFAKWSQKSHGL